MGATILDILLMILFTGLGLGGLVFSILPPIPGPILPLGGLWMLHFLHARDPFTIKFMLIMTGVTILVMIIENIVPIWGTKKMGGSKAGIWGSTIGLFVGMFFLTPFMIFAGPFAPVVAIMVGTFGGAVVGEVIHGQQMDIAFKSGLGSFFGFIAGTGLKLMLCGVILYQGWSIYF